MIWHNVLWILYIVSAILSIIGGFLVDYIFMPVEAEIHFVWDNIPNFTAIFGFLGSIMLLTGAIILKKILSRDDYIKSDDFDDL